jgi:hypothetical protein
MEIRPKRSHYPIRLTKRAAKMAGEDEKEAEITGDQRASQAGDLRQIAGREHCAGTASSRRFGPLLTVGLLSSPTPQRAAILPPMWGQKLFATRHVSG